MTSPVPFSAAGPLKDYFVSTLIPTAINDSTVLVTYGHPGMEFADDMIGVGRVTSSQEQATMSPNRSREELLTVEVTISCYRGGGQEQEQICGDRAYALLGAIERQVRVNDVTCGDNVRDCFLTAHVADGATDPQFLASGRCIEIQATFTARVRISTTH